MAETKQSNKELGDMLSAIKNMQRFDLEWEWMKESDSGEFIKFSDIEAYILRRLKSPNAGVTGA